MLQITDEAAAILDSQFVVREIDRQGNPHFLLKVPDLQKAPEADVGVEIRRDPDGCVLINLLLYDIPTEPVSYEMRFSPSNPGDLRFLHAFIDSAHFRMHPCARVDDRWEVSKSQSFRVPASVLLRLKHFSLEWPDRATLRAAAQDSKIGGDLAAQAAPPPRELRPEDPPPAATLFPELEPPPATFAPDDAPPPETSAAPAASPPRRTQGDPRDTIIQKLKQQNQGLRSQLREKDKRIIELEDELNEIKSRGRNYRLSGDKKSWWKPF